MFQPRFRTLEEMVVASAEMVRPPERLTVSQAATKYRKLDNQGSYVGPWPNEKTPYLVEPMDELTSLNYTGMVFVGPARTGKALAVDTPIPTPSGWTTMAALSVGDEVFGSNGMPTRISFKSETFIGHDCYRVTMSDGSSIIADAGHKWLVTDSANHNEKRTVTTEYMAQRVQYRKNRRTRFLIENPLPLMFTTKKELPLDPYILGLWLGDGHNIGARLASSELDWRDITKNIEELNHPCRHSVSETGKHTIYISSARFSHRGGGERDVVAGALFNMGMLRGRPKFIPDDYFTASIEQRLALVQGLLDTDGSCDKRGLVEFCNTESSLISGMRKLLWSLGIKHTVKTRPTIGKDAHRICFTPGGSMRFFRLQRKQSRLRQLTPRGLASVRKRSIVAIEKVDSIPTQCIGVEAADHLYVAGEGCVLTHNSDMGLNWVSHTAICDPMDMIFYNMSMTSARDWSTKELRRLLRNSPEVGARVLPGKHNANVGEVRFASGMSVMIRWPAITEMSGKTVPYVWLFDYDRMPLDVDGEGPPFDLGRKRTTTYKRFGMTVAESSPGHDVNDPNWIASSPHEAPPAKGIAELYNRGDRRRWYWRCIFCRHAFEPHFKLLNYPKCDDPMEAAEMVTMKCPLCDMDITPNYKPELNGTAKWIKAGQLWLPDGSVAGRARKSDIASFWLMGPAAAFQDWSSLVYSYLQAVEAYEKTGDEGPLRKTTNTDQGLNYTPKSLESNRLPEELKARAVDWGGSADRPVVPPGVRFLVATVDVQAGARKMFVVHVYGIGEGFDIYHIDMFRILKSERLDKDGDPLPIDPSSFIEDWYLLEKQVMLKSYPLGDGSGREMSIKVTGCDSGGEDGVTANAYNFYRHLRDGETGLHNRFVLIKGDPTKGAPRVRLSYPDSNRKDRHAGARGDIPVLLLNPNLLKDQAFGMLGRTLPGGGMIHFPSWAENWLYTQLTAEVRGPKGWEKKTKRNEAWDLLVYCIAICLHSVIRIEKIDWDNPPAWAEEWEKNDLVFNPLNQQPIIIAVPKVDYDLKALAERLA